MLYRTVRELSRVADLNEATIRNKIKSGRLPAQKFGREWLGEDRDFHRFLAERAARSAQAGSGAPMPQASGR